MLASGCASGGGESVLPEDAGTADSDSADLSLDAQLQDSAVDDAAPMDGAMDAASDAGGPDAGPRDLGTDAGPVLLGMIFTSPNLGGGTAGVISTLSFVIEFDGGTCTSGPIGESVPWSAPGMFDFNVTNDPDFASLIACLTDSFEEDILSSTHAGSGGGGNRVLESTAFGAISGHTIDFIRLVVEAITITNNGSFSMYTETVHWELWGQ